MSRRGPARAVTLVVLTTALVAGASAVETPVRLPAATAGGPAETGAGTPELAPVGRAVLSCPGPEQQGLPDPSVPEQEQSVTVLAVSAPQEVLPATAGAGGDRTGADDGAAGPDEPADGTLELVPTEAEATSAGSRPAGTTLRGESAQVVLDGPQGVVARATGALAPGLAAGQWHLSTAEQRRGLSGTACTQAQDEVWLVAGGLQAGRLERLVVVNPGADPVTAAVEVLGGAGRAEVVGGLVVPGGGRLVALLDALAPGQADPVVRVTTAGGPVSAFLGDRWLEGSTDRGLELTTATAAPARDHVVPGVRVSGEGSTLLRVAVPGEEQAVVQVRGLTDDGPVRLQQDVTLAAAGSSQEILVGGLPDGLHALEVTSDVPVVVAASATTAPASGDVTDLAWSPSVPPLAGLAGLPLPIQDAPVEGLRSVLQLAGRGAAVAEVSVVAQDGSTSLRQVVVEGPGTTPVPLADAASVWVRPVSGELVAAVAVDAEDDALLTVVPLQGLPLLRSLTDVEPSRP
jgi:Family of unknown function (DUF5719)